jgi:hypothetical protein
VSGKLFRLIDLTDLGPEGESEPLVYVGVYVLRWGKENQPSVGFVNVDDPKIEAATDLYNALYPFAKALKVCIENQEIWKNALDRVGSEDFLRAHEVIKGIINSGTGPSGGDWTEEDVQ